jgi:hypothetical protein
MMDYRGVACLALFSRLVFSFIPRYGLARLPPHSTPIHLGLQGSSDV